MLDEPLRKQLLRMLQEDLAVRAELVNDGCLFGGYAERMAALHRRHNAQLDEILSLRGWPGRSLVGEDGATAAWVLLQHAVLEPRLMRRALPMIEHAVTLGEAESRHLAFLVDRIRTLEGRPQVYGTSHDWDAHGKLVPLPIEDEQAVAERRRRAGLEPLEENTRRLREQAAIEGERAPEDHEQRQKDMDQWARSVGWRD